jgi:alpha-galactosidase
MGWSSWDAYGTTVTEAQVKANAEVMAGKLAGLGWKYILVEIQWYGAGSTGYDYPLGLPLSMDLYGRLIPAVNRFPSSANGAGFRPLADYIHSKGLKFGIHVMRGIPRQAVEQNLPIKGTKYRAADIADRDNPCSWDPDMWGVDTTKPGAQEYYDSIVELYASWGVDYIKADDLSSRLYQPAEIRALSRAIQKSGRSIVLSLSPGPAPLLEEEFLKKHAQMWRISYDFWDNWAELKKQFDNAREWAPFVGVEGTWPDADMLPIGPVRLVDKGKTHGINHFTPDEQRTTMTLWSIFGSPLLIGGDLPTMDDFALSLVTNPEVLAVDQHSTQRHEAFRRGDFVAWAADSPNAGEHYVALFNMGESEGTLNAAWREFGINTDHAEVRDLWQRKDLATMNRVSITLRRHAAALYRVTAQ